jgi:hypothetical protein
MQKSTAYETALFYCFAYYEIIINVATLTINPQTAKTKLGIPFILYDSPSRVFIYYTTK